MTDVTNRTIAALLFVAMAVTVFSTAVTLNKLNVVQGGDLTGFAISPNATATLNVSATTSIKFVNAVIDWSNGTVNTSGGNLQCNLTTNGWSTPGYTGCVGFITPLPGDFQLENDGNQNASITVEITTASDTWIGGNAALSETYVEIKDAETGSCVGGGAAFLNSGAETVITTVGDQVACSNFAYEDGADTINISLKVSLPSDAPVGVKTVDLIATATAV